MSACIIKRTRTRTQNFKKTDPGSLKTADPMLKFTIMVKIFFLNLRLLISNMKIVFTNPSPKERKEYLDKAFLVPNLIFTL